MAVKLIFDVVDTRSSTNRCTIPLKIIERCENANAKPIFDCKFNYFL